MSEVEAQSATGLDLVEAKLVAHLELVPVANASMQIALEG
jgi:hypothetical protein